MTLNRIKIKSRTIKIVKNNANVIYHKLLTCILKYKYYTYLQFTNLSNKRDIFCVIKILQYTILIIIKFSGTL